jgi:TRAP-type C4-dicarboxylate transport system substrate-binding protein
MYRRITLLGLAAAMVVSVTATASAVTLKYSSWTPPPAPNNHYGTIPLFKQLEQDTNGTLKFQNFMGAQLFNAFTTLPGISEGAVDAGVTVPVFNAAELKAHTTMGELQALTRDGWSGAGAGTELVLMDCKECIDDYAKMNAISLGVYGGAGYFMQCNDDLTQASDLKGKKLGDGSAVFARFAKQIGMSRIQMGPGDYLQALQRGTVDCIVGPLEWQKGYSLADATKTVIQDVQLGVFATVSLVTFNKNSWDKLSTEHKKAIVNRMPEAIARTVNGYYVNEKEGIALAKKKHVKFVNFGSEFQKMWDDFAKSEPKSIAEAAKGRGAKTADEIVDMSIKALKKWEGIVDKEGQNEAAFAKSLKDHVYDKVKLY